MSPFSPFLSSLQWCFLHFHAKHTPSSMERTAAFGAQKCPLEKHSWHLTASQFIWPDNGATDLFGPQPCLLPEEGHFLPCYSHSQKLECLIRGRQLERKWGGGGGSTAWVLVARYQLHLMYSFGSHLGKNGDP